MTFSILYIQGYQLTTQMLLDTGCSFSRALLSLESTSADFASISETIENKNNENAELTMVEKDQSMNITRYYLSQKLI